MNKREKMIFCIIHKREISLTGSKFNHIISNSYSIRAFTRREAIIKES